MMFGATIAQKLLRHIIKKGSQKFTEGGLLKLPYLTNTICLSASHHAFNFPEQTNISIAQLILFWSF